MQQSPSEVFAVAVIACICIGIEPNSNVGRITDCHIEIFLKDLKRGNNSFLDTFLLFYRKMIGS